MSLHGLLCPLDVSFAGASDPAHLPTVGFQEFPRILDAFSSHSPSLLVLLILSVFFTDLVGFVHFLFKKQIFVGFKIMKAASFVVFPLMHLPWI